MSVIWIVLLSDCNIILFSSLRNYVTFIYIYESHTFHFFKLKHYVHKVCIIFVF